MLGLGLALVGIEVSNSEQLSDGLEFMDPEFTEHILVVDHVAKGGDYPRWINLKDGVADATEMLDKLAQHLVLALDDPAEIDLGAGVLGRTLEVGEEIAI
jgi:hypothetical protein